MTDMNRRQVLMGVSSLVSLGLIGCDNTRKDAGAGTQDDFNANTLLNSDALNAPPGWEMRDQILNDLRKVDIPDTQFPINEFGGLEANKGDARPMILAAIDAAHSAGGGRVVIPEGLWRSFGPIHLKSNVELHVTSDAHLQFQPGAENYLPLVLTRWEGTEVYNYSPFIYARDQENIAITGPGLIDGQGEEHWLVWRPDQNPDKNKLRDMGRDGVPLEDRVFGPGHKLRPHFIQFINCQRVLLDGFSLIDSPFWCIHPVYCSDVTVSNISITSPHLNSDGVDPDSSNRVLIENCKFRVRDDGIALKAGRDQDGWRVGKVCQNIVIRNCDYEGSAGGAIAIGSEMSGGVRNVFVEDIRITKAIHGLYFKANLDRGGFIEDVRIRNIEADDVASFITFTNEYHSYRGGSFPPNFRRVSISRASTRQAKIGIHITGHPDAPVEDIHLEDVTIGTADAPMQLADYKRVKFINVEIGGERLVPHPTEREKFLPFKR